MAVFFGLNLTTWLIGAVLAIYYWYRYKSHAHYWKRKNVPSENPKFLQRLSNIFTGKTSWDQERELYEKHGKICGIYFRQRPALLVSDPALIRLILVKDFQSFPNKKTFYAPKSLLGRMLTCLNGEEWKRVRCILTPVFTSCKIRKMAYLVNASAYSVTNSFLKCADRKIPVDLRKQFGAFTLEIIASTAFGTDLDSSKNPDNTFAIHARRVVTWNLNWKVILFALSPKLAAKLGVKMFDKTAIDFFENLVLRIREQRLNGGKVREDFLQMLLDIESDTSDQKNHEDNNYYGSEEGSKISLKHNLKKTLTKEELVAQCMLFFFAAFEATGVALTMITFLLALNPESQERLLAEVDQTWEKHEGKMDFDTVSSMKYLEAVIAETLRLYPPFTKLKRTCVQDYVIGDTGITIPKGMIVHIPIYGMHRDPEYFPEPEKFRPERFLPENKDSIKPYTYLPFGSGPRNCLAMRFALMEVKLGLVQILRHVSFHKCQETETRFEFNQFADGTLFQPKSVTVEVKRRR